MNDKNLGMIVATAIATPVVIICCGGGLALTGAGLAGLSGLLSGSGILISALIALAVGIALLALRNVRRTSHPTDTNTQPKG